ncbi:hypothetical protein HOLleu_33829 [Holothuria leucospilota]|uniref:PH domain-containing protein n=1 Tax=Holothuria leucospilota TaxID=206669 RepID=A0A9Q1BHZ4_HOLLE|nr:hypothetical protein HOLleu_33829 [Holothuria leucospilota]
MTAQVKSNDKKFCFAIKTAYEDDRDWVFSAPTSDKMRMWIAAFEATIDFINHGRIRNWTLKILEKEKPFIKAQQTEDDKGKLRNEYTAIRDKEACADDEQIYAQPDETWTDLTDKDLSILAGKFGHRWRDFAREKLLLIQSDIECIEGTYIANIKEQMFHALLQWRRNQIGPNTKAKLIALLKCPGYCNAEA